MSIISRTIINYYYFCWLNGLMDQRFDSICDGFRRVSSYYDDPVPRLHLRHQSVNFEPHFFRVITVDENLVPKMESQKLP